MKKAILVTSIVCLFILIFIDMNAQCAMCKAVVESEYDPSGVRIGSGINKGILYLMGIPYVLIATMIFFYIRRKHQSI